MKIMRRIRSLMFLNEPVDQTKKNRESRHILTQMHFLYGNIENAVFAAELRCSDEFRCESGSACSFKKGGECIVPKIRELLGERVF